MEEKPKKRYSRQRESILDYLSNTLEHPTANMIYDKVRESIPNISLGTVYRNLATLVEEGDVLKIDTGDNAERYDIRVKAHGHLICNKCGAVSDVFMEYEDKLDEIAEKVSGAEIKTHQLVFEGTCLKCLGVK